MLLNHIIQKVYYLKIKRNIERYFLFFGVKQICVK